MCQAVEEWKQELLDEGEKIGINKGKAEGKTEGKAEGKAEALICLMQNFKMSLEQALKGLNIPESEWTEYRMLVNQMQAAQ